MERRRNWMVGLGLFSITLALYWPATTFPFVSFDDPEYVSQNPHVSVGLTGSGIVWSATSIVAGNWHPVTMWSHMVDSSIYGGVFAAGHHLTNILLHALNAALLFLLLKRLTGWFWASALVAALLAWHPLNVESVAWVSERKNVLSTLFFILTLWAYWNYMKKTSASRYFAYTLSLLWFALGLASKSMLVTLPFLLLLLDYWPLRRTVCTQNTGDPSRPKPLGILFLEKIPFLVLAVADGWITYLAQNHSGAVHSFSTVPLENRLLNIPVAYFTYLAKTFWPDGLCAFYPFPSTPDIAAAVATTILLVAMTFVVWYWRSKQPWLLVGWFWFLGTLVPVIGLVQVGGQAWADRYAYLPLIGIFLLIAGGLRQCLVVRPQWWIFVVTGAGLFLVICLVLTGRQLMFWRSSVALFTRTLEISPKNSTAENLLGGALALSGGQNEAIEHYAAAVRMRPKAAKFQYDLGRALMNASRIPEALDHLATAVALSEKNPVFHNAYGVALVLGNHPAEAQKEFSRAIELQPDSYNARFNLGKVLLTTDDSRAAITQLNLALKSQPDWPEALQNLARAYAAGGDTSNAISVALRALKIAQTKQPSVLANQIAAELKTYQSALTPQSSSGQTNLPNVQQP